MNTRMLLLAASVGFLAGCPDDDTHSNNDSPPASPPVQTDAEKQYELTVTNLTVSQPLSPLAILAHSCSYQLFQVGQPASLALEKVAESGDNTDLLAEKDSNDNVTMSYSGAGVILPGSADSLTFEIAGDSASQLSIASMLVNTNDGFVGETGIDLSRIAVGESYTMNMPVWDAGTEANSETSASIPGPAAGGEGFNTARDDDDKVSFHPGVVSLDDGLTTSALTASHRFLNPGARLSITRIK